MTERIRLICPSNNAAILQANLARSPCLDRLPLSVIEGASSATVAFNRGLDESDEEILVFLHHDVFLPRGWDSLLHTRLAQITARHPDWAVLGAFGVGLDHRGYGPVWSSSLGAIIGAISPAPVAVQSIDELMIILRRDAGLRFDEELLGWHLTGTDIVTAARAAGRGAYVVPLPLVHNDGYKDDLDASFLDAYTYLRRKWASRLPLRSPILKISRSGWHYWRMRWQNRHSRAFRQNMAIETARDPAELAALCGWADLSASGGLPGSEG